MKVQLQGCLCLLCWAHGPTGNSKLWLSSGFTPRQDVLFAIPLSPHAAPFSHFCYVLGPYKYLTL